MGSERLQEQMIDVGAGAIVLVHGLKSRTISGKWELYAIDNDQIPAPLNLSFDYLIHLRDEVYAIAQTSLQDVDRALRSATGPLKISLHIVDNSLSPYYLFFEGAFVDTQLRSAYAGDTLPERQIVHGEFDWQALEEELQQSKMLLEAAIQSDVIALSVLKPVFTEDDQIRDFKWVMANKLLRAIAHGQHVVGKLYCDVFPDSSRNGVLSLLIKAYITGQRQTNEVYYQDAYVKGWMRETYYRSRDYVIVSAEDITWHKRTSDELSSSRDHLVNMNASLAHHAEAQYWELFQSIDQGFAILKPDDRANVSDDFVFVQTNSAFERMMGSDNVVGRDLRSSFPDLFSELCSIFNEVMSTRSSKRSVIAAERGERCYFEVFVFPTGTNIPKLGALFSDVTKQRSGEHKLKELNARLLEVDREKSSFFSKISHEFKTPLTLMLGPLNELAEAKGGLPEAELNKLKMITRNAARLQKLVNSLLDLSKVETRTIETYYQPTDIAHFTLQLTSTFRSIIEHAGLKFRCEMEQVDEPVYLNREMWEKIVLNLLSNAFKFTHRGRIDVILKLKRNKIQLQVKDTGVGIPASAFPKLFQRFSRIEQTRGRTNEGSGIGLALVKDFVAAHGGTVTVRSKEGVGSVFTVTIPKGKSHLLPEQIYESTKEQDNHLSPSFFAEEANSWMPENEKFLAATVAKAKKISGDRPCIMVVDDNADMREYLSAILQESYHVIVVENGLRAIKILLKGMHPDLILTDVMMPEMDGFGLISAVKSNKALAHIPTVLLSGKSMEEAKLEGYRYGADDYIAKPFTAGELRTVIQARLLMAAARKTAQQELLAQNVELAKDIRSQTEALMEQQSTVRRQNKELFELNETLQRRNHELKVAAEELGNFSQITSHDLREPLRKMQLYFSRLIKPSQHFKDPDATFIIKIRESIERMNLLLNDVKKYSELRAPETNGAKSVDLRELITLSWNKLTSEANECNATIHCGSLCVLRANPSQLLVLFQNLLSNAIKFRFPHTEPLIIISGRYVDSAELGVPFSTFCRQYYEVNIADNGIGCDQLYAEKIFNMFQRLTVTEEFRGSGMGLAICKRIIDNHRGVIRVKSEPGLGSTFSCYLPADSR